MKKLQINKANLVDNISKIKAHTDSVIIAALKNNGYGLGLNEYPHILFDEGIDFFAVSTIDEALTLRQNGFANKIMLLHSTSIEEDILALIENDIIPTIGSFTALEKINEIAKDTINVQIKVDTGFGRFGFLPDEIKNLTDALKKSPKINILGTFSHFSMSFNKSAAFTKKQFSTFMACIQTLKENDINPGLLHICNSSAFLQYKGMHLDAVRIGSAFLGRFPVQNNLSLNKIGQLVSEIEDIKELPQNHFIGYSNTYKTKNKIKIGIVPVGYLDGFGLKKAQDCFRSIDILREIYSAFCSYKTKPYVKIGGKKAPILGKIGTNNITAAILSDTSVGSEVLMEVNPMLVRPDIKREFI